MRLDASPRLNERSLATMRLPGNAFPLPNVKAFPDRPDSQRADTEPARSASSRPSTPHFQPSKLAALARKLPTGRDQASVDQRKALFRKFDGNGNGFLSLAEVDKAVRDVLQSEELFDSKPAVKSAFRAARRANGNRRGRSGDFVERNEFRQLLRCLRVHLELYTIFQEVDFIPEEYSPTTCWPTCLLTCILTYSFSID